VDKERGGKLNNGAFYTRCKMKMLLIARNRPSFPKLLVDTGSEYTWVSAATLEKLGIQRERRRGVCDGQWQQVPAVLALRSFAWTSSLRLMRSCLQEGDLRLAGGQNARRLEPCGRREAKKNSSRQDFTLQLYQPKLKRGKLKRKGRWLLFTFTFSLRYVFTF